MQVPVARAMDAAFPGKGTVYVKSCDLLTVHGLDTKFTEQLAAKASIWVHGQTYEVSQVISDTEIRLKKPVDNAKVLEVLERANAMEAGSEYKCVPAIDHHRMFDTVVDRLLKRECIGIFPEGGSHDRTEFLPLKAGFTIMALSALAKKPDLDLKIVPCGLNYFHPHRFRSRAVIEFGEPISISPELVAKFKAGGLDKREACSALMDETLTRLKSITVNVPDYDTLMVLQAARRIYKPDNMKIELHHTLALTRNLAIGYQVNANEPKVKELFKRVKEYNSMLATYGIRDHQVKNTVLGGKIAIKLLTQRLFVLFALAIIIIPGWIINAPVVIIAQTISRIKARASTVKIVGTDVMGTWKVLVALFLVPMLNLMYTTILSNILYFDCHWSFSSVFFAGVCFFMVGYPVLSFLTIIGTESGVDIIKSLRPLVLCLLPGSDTKKLIKTRNSLQQMLIEVVEEYGPSTFDNFEHLKKLKGDWKHGILETSDSEADHLAWKDISEQDIDDVFIHRNSVNVSQEDLRTRKDK